MDVLVDFAASKKICTRNPIQTYTHARAIHTYAHVNPKQTYTHTHAQAIPTYTHVNPKQTYTHTHAHATNAYMQNMYTCQCALPNAFCGIECMCTCALQPNTSLHTYTHTCKTCIPVDMTSSILILRHRMRACTHSTTQYKLIHIHSHTCIPVNVLVDFDFAASNACVHALYNSV